MRSTRPLEIPRHVCFASCLGTLLRNIGDPTGIGFQTIESIGLKNAEGNDGGKSTGDQTDRDHSPVVANHGRWTMDHASFVGCWFTVDGQISYCERTWQQDCQWIDVELR